MADYAVATLGAFAFDGVNGAAIEGVIEIGPLPRTVNVAANALSAAPVQTSAFVSGFRQVKLPVKLAGRETQGETAPEHLQRMLTNLRTEVQKDTNTLLIEPYGMPVVYTYTVYKNEDFPVVIAALTQSRSVLTFDVTLNCLP